MPRATAATGDTVEGAAVEGDAVSPPSITHEANGDGSMISNGDETFEEHTVDGANQPISNEVYWTEREEKDSRNFNTEEEDTCASGYSRPHPYAPCEGRWLNSVRLNATNEKKLISFEVMLVILFF